MMGDTYPWRKWLKEMPIYLKYYIAYFGSKNNQNKFSL